MRTYSNNSILYYMHKKTKNLRAPRPLVGLETVPRRSRPGVTLEEATADVDEVEGPDNDEGMVADEGVDVVANGSWEHKKLRAKVSILLYLSRDVAGPVKMTG